MLLKKMVNHAIDLKFSYECETEQGSYVIVIKSCFVTK